MEAELRLGPGCPDSQSEPFLSPISLYFDVFEDTSYLQNYIILNKDREVNPYILFKTPSLLESIILCPHYPLSTDSKELYILSARLHLGPGQIELII